MNIDPPNEKEQLKFMAWRRYKESWGNYRSDKWKSKRILKTEISDIMSLGSFNKEDLINIKEFIIGLGFDEFV